MYRLLILMMLLLLPLSLAEAGEMLKNRDFAAVYPNGKMRNWECSGPEGSFSFNSKDGSVLMRPGPGKEMLLKQNIAPQKDSRYELSFEAKSSQNSKVQAYCEWVINTSGGKKWLSVNAAPMVLKNEWERHTFPFTVGEQELLSLYFAAKVNDGGEAQLRDISIKRLGPAQLPARRELGGIWKIKDNAGFVVGGEDDGLLWLKKSINPGATLSGIRLEAGKKYCLSFSVKGQGSSGTHTGYHAFRLHARLAAEKTDIPSPWDDTMSLLQRKQFVFTVPGKTGSVSTDIVFEARTNGELRFADFSLEQVKPTPADLCRIAMTSPAYRNTIFSSLPVKVVSGTISVPEKSALVKVRLEQEEKVLQKTTAKLNAGKYSFSFPAAALPQGEYRISVEAFDTAGKTLAANNLSLKKLPPAPVEVVQDSRKNFLINGKAFFPLTFWSLPGSGEERLYWAARHGVNCFITGSKSSQDLLRQLETFDRYGIKLLFKPGFARSAEGEEFAEWRDKLQKVLSPEVKAHPALFGYFLTDEPSWSGTPYANLASSYEALKELDPYRPVWINAAPRGPLEEHALYSRAADIYGVDIYPIPYPNTHSGLEDKSPASVGKYSSMICKATDNAKAVWMVLQGFSWGEYVNLIQGQNKQAVYPSMPELRFMACDALLNGATSVSYWGMHYIRDESFFNRLLQMTGELHSLSRLMVEGARTEGAKVDSDLQCTVLTCTGEQYLLVLNPSAQEKKGTVSCAFDAERMLVLGEDRTVTVTGRIFSDHFPPFSAHIYGTAQLPEPLSALPEVNPEYERKGDPFLRFIRMQKAKVPYAGSASWIWSSQSRDKEGTKVWLVREFELDAKPKSAKLYFSANDRGTVWLNGKQLDSSTDWETMKTADCGESCRKGKNILAIKANNQGHQTCGLLAELNIVTADGEKICLKSDEQWRVSNNSVPDWPNPKNIEAWENAKELAPYGEGIWSRRIRIAGR